MAACPGAQIKITPPSRYRISWARVICCNPVASSTTWSMPSSMPAASIAKLSTAPIVMIGCWPWSRAASVFSEILDRERGRHCHTPGESGILAGSKPEDRERKAVFGCCRRTRPRGDVVSVARRRPSCGQEPVRSGTQQPERGRLTSAPIPVTVHSAATGISSICSCRITPDSGSNSPTHGACSRAALVCE